MSDDYPIFEISWEKLNSNINLKLKENFSDLEFIYLLTEEVFPCLLYCGICCEMFPAPFWLSSTPYISLNVNGHPKEAPYVKIEIPQGLTTEDIKLSLTEKDKNCIFLSDDGFCCVHQYLPQDGPCRDYAKNIENSPGEHFPCVRAFINREFLNDDFRANYFKKLFIKITVEILQTFPNSVNISRRLWSNVVYKSLIQSKKEFKDNFATSKENIIQFCNTFNNILEKTFNFNLD